MKTKNLKRWLPVLIIVSLMIAFYATGLHEKISLQALQDNKESLLNYVDNHPILTALGFIAVYITFVALSLPAATLLTLTGGFLFGKWLGTLYVVSAATIGGTLVFLVAKTSLGASLRDKAGGLYKKIEDNMQEGAVSYLLFMRLVPVFPFFLVNIAPALFDVKLRTFVLTTFFGIIPGTFVFVNVGTQLADITSLSDLVSVQTLVALGLLGVVALIPTVYKQIKKHKKSLSSMVFIGLLFIVQVQANQSELTFEAHYDTLLKAYVMPVNTTEINYFGVDYDAWSNDKTHQQALNQLLGTNPNELSHDHKMAFWINAYNFLTIELIIRENERDSIKNLGGLFSSPWTKHSWEIAGTEYSLDEIEHEILRPMGDARIHFAINCASVSCPDLRPEIYSAEQFNKQLDDQVKHTLSNPNKGFRASENKLHVSKIFKWFAGDFNDGGVKKWLSDYLEIDLNQDLAYMQYDWSLNNTTKEP